MTTSGRGRARVLATAALMAALSMGGVSGAEAVPLVGTAVPTVGVRAVDASPGQDAFEAEVLKLTNQARAKARTCGGKRYSAAKPLRWSDTLARTAAAHSADMANRNYFSHYAPGRVSPFDRMRAAGYRYRAAGENIAAGRSLDTPEAVVRAWLKSPGHCKVIMNPKYRDLGVGRVEGAGRWGVYFTQNFGRRR